MPLPKHREAPPLRIISLQSAAGQLCFQRAILLAKERDDIGLLTLEPSAQGGDQQLEREHGRSLRHRDRLSVGTGAMPVR